MRSAPSARRLRRARREHTGSAHASGGERMSRRLLDAMLAYALERRPEDVPEIRRRIVEWELNEGPQCFQDEMSAE